MVAGTAVETAVFGPEPKELEITLHIGCHAQTGLVSYKSTPPLSTRNGLLAMTRNPEFA